MNSTPSRRVKADDTQAFYEEHAKKYFESTVGIDVGGLRERFLRYVLLGGRILDAGSGSGRDTRAFHALGYEVEAFDASPALADLSTRFTGIPTQVRKFEDFTELPRFDGIWACASLLHVSEDRLRDVLVRLVRALKPQGAIYVSFKEGAGESTLADGRRFTNLTLDSLDRLLGSLAEVIVQEIWSYPAQSSSKQSEVWVNAIATRV